MAINIHIAAVFHARFTVYTTQNQRTFPEIECTLYRRMRSCAKIASDFFEIFKQLAASEKSLRLTLSVIWRLSDIYRLTLQCERGAMDLYKLMVWRFLTLDAAIKTAQVWIGLKKNEKLG